MVEPGQKLFNSVCKKRLCQWRCCRRHLTTNYIGTDQSQLPEETCVDAAILAKGRSCTPGSGGGGGGGGKRPNSSDDRNGKLYSLISAVLGRQIS